jgi:hypothetical protein
MSVRDKKSVEILNYNENSVVVKTRDNEFLIEPGSDDCPSIIPLTIDEIVYINSSSVAFKSGIIFPPTEYEKEIYEDILRIRDWRKILKNSEIKNILIYPTQDGVQKLVDTEDPIVFDRIRSIYVHLKNLNKYDLSIRVGNYIEERKKEFDEKKYKTQIVVSAINSGGSLKSAENESLKAENELMKKHLEEMQKKIDELVNSQKKTDVVEDSSPIKTKAPVRQKKTE